MPTDKQVLEIVETLARLETRLDGIASGYETLQATVNDRMDRLEGRIEKMQHLLLGNGSPGIVTRLDRLEQSEQRRTRLSWITITAAIGALVTAFARMFR